MIADFDAFTDGALYAVYDAATAQSFIDKKIDLGDLLNEPEKTRDVIWYSEAADGSKRFRVYIDEEPPPEVTAHAFGKVDNMLLRMPAGQLVVSGAEYITEPEEQHPVAIPAGEYRALGFDVHFTKEETQQHLERALGHALVVPLHVSAASL